MNIKLRMMIDTLADAITIPYDKQKLDTSLRNNNIEVGYFFNGIYNAFLKWDYYHNKPLIAVDAFQAFQSSHRANFLLAHELGHLIINYDWSPCRDNNNLSKEKILSIDYRKNAYNTNEQIIDEFATDFLIPNHIMSKVLTKFKNSDTNDIIKYVSNRFYVSRQIAKLRLKIIHNEQQIKFNELSE